MEAKSSNIKNSILSGLISGSITATTLQPFEYIKTKLQLPEKLDPKRPSSNTATKTSPNRTIRSIIRETLIADGSKPNLLNVKKFWTGLSPSLMRTIPVAGIYFGSIDFLRNTPYLSHSVSGGRFQLLHSFLIGIISRTVADSFTHPLSLIKTRFESDRYNYKSVLNAFRTIFRIEGLTGLYKGLGATLLRDIAYSGIYFALYTKSRHVIKESENSFIQKHRQSSFLVAFCALSSSVLACALTQPSDVVRSYMQLNPSEFKSFGLTMKSIYAKHGASGFFAGFLPRSLRRVLISVMSWTIFERLTVRNLV